MRKGIVRSILAGTLLAGIGLPGAVHAVAVDDFVLTDANGLSPESYFGFSLISSNGDASNIDLGLAVSFGNTPGDERMYFEFVNASLAPNDQSAITGVFFETTDLLGPPAFVDGTASGVRFGSGNGGSGGFGVTFNRDLSMVAGPPRVHSGIGSGQSLLLGYDFNGNAASLAGDVLTGLQQGQWTIGVHLQATGADAEASEKLVATFFPDGPRDPDDPQIPVSEPATVVLLGMGTSFLVARRRFC